MSSPRMRTPPSSLGGCRRPWRPSSRRRRGVVRGGTWKSADDASTHTHALVVDTIGMAALGRSREGLTGRARVAPGLLDAHGRPRIGIHGTEVLLYEVYKAGVPWMRIVQY